MTDLDGAANGAVDAAGAALIDGLRQWNERLTSLADFDGDGNVDADDLARWKSGFGVNSGAQHEHGDGDGDVDGGDRLVWQRQAAAAGSVSAATPAPEPTWAALVLSAFVAGGFRRRCGRTSR